MKGLITLGVIAAIVGTVIFMSKTTDANPPVNPDKPAETSNTGAQTQVKVVAPIKIALLCAYPTQILDNKLNNGKPAMEVQKVMDGKAHEYLNIPDGWIHACHYDEIKDKPGKLPGRARYDFEVPRDDTYFVHLRAQWMDTCGNSVWVNIDGGETSDYYNLEDEFGFRSEKHYDMTWHPLYVGGRPKEFHLKAGKHSLFFGVREDGPLLHQWLISTESNTPPQNREYEVTAAKS